MNADEVVWDLLIENSRNHVVHDVDANRYARGMHLIRGCNRFWTYVNGWLRRMAA